MIVLKFGLKLLIMTDPIRIMVAVETPSEIVNVLPVVEAAGMFDTQALKNVGVILGKVASREIIPIIAEVPGIVAIEEQREVRTVD